jgi:hypothetical protein
MCISMQTVVSSFLEVSLSRVGVSQFQPAFPNQGSTSQCASLCVLTGGDFTPVRSGSQSNISLSSREVGTPTARNSSIQQGQGSSDSPLVQRGLMLNVSTGRAIKIGGPTYQALQDKVLLYSDPSFQISSVFPRPRFFTFPSPPPPPPGGNTALYHPSLLSP